MCRSVPSSARFISIACALIACAAGTARAQAWPSVSTALPKVGGGEHDVAVVVGVSDYGYLPKIPGAADNAAAWEQNLVRVLGVPADHALLLTNNDATREKIMKALRAAMSSSSPDGV